MGDPSHPAEWAPAAGRVAVVAEEVPRHPAKSHAPGLLRELRYRTVAQTAVGPK